MFEARRIKHCRVCGATVTYRVPADDNRDRAICNECGEIHYENPINVVGTVPVWNGQVLLCRRNIEPRKGFWTLPAGFLEMGESSADGALRETDEEAGSTNFDTPFGQRSTMAWSPTPKVTRGSRATHGGNRLTNAIWRRLTSRSFSLLLRNG